MNDTNFDPDCGCGDFQVTRRSLLKTAGIVSMAGVVTSMFGGVLSSTVYGAENDSVLVVLSLRGGADGLSMVVPHAEPAYYSARPNTAIARNRLLHADSTFGLHPNFAPLSSLWSSGKLAAIHAVGLPAPNRSHFEAMELLEDADLGSSARVGWINRMVSSLGSGDDPFNAVQLGSAMTPTSLVGPAATLAAVNFGDLQLPFADNAAMLERVEVGLRAQYLNRTDLLGEAAASAMAIAERSASISAFAKQGAANGAVYQQNSELGEALRNAAALIRKGVGVKAVALDFGNWDHHSGLDWGISGQVKELSANLAAFFGDLGAHADRVTVVTLSEFGRRLRQNGSYGVDHGYGNAVLVAGAGVKGGKFYARWPTLNLGKQVDGDLAVTTDYRNVIAEILRSRFPSVNTSAVFPGLTQSSLDFMS